MYIDTLLHYTPLACRVKVHKGKISSTARFIYAVHL